MGEDPRQLRLLDDPTDPHALSPVAVHDAFDPARLTQARHLAGMTKRALAEQLGVTATAVGQYELGLTRPRPDLLPRLGAVLAVPLAFFLAGRPHARLDGTMAHFRSLRSTRVYQRDKALAMTEQAWELTHALEKHVELPTIDLPDHTTPSTHHHGHDSRDARDVGDARGAPGPVAAARALRRAWGLGHDTINHLVRRIEAHGIVVLTPPPDPDSAAVDAFSTSRLPRPIMVLTPNRADDVYRHRFTAAHELGHLVLHHDHTPGDPQHERDADTFAAEFLTPRDAIAPSLPRRVDLTRLTELQRLWGVSVHSLIYRSREIGLLSDAAARRAYQRLQALRQHPGFRPEPVAGYPGEQPVLLARAVDLAAENGLTHEGLCNELGWHAARLDTLLGLAPTRPRLTLVT
jgi:Zn-dependent peptidase ImmA (M78 family)/transcriptional regulator with XRE-family HTH domain